MSEKDPLFPVWPVCQQLLIKICLKVSGFLMLTGEKFVAPSLSKSWKSSLRLGQFESLKLSLLSLTAKSDHATSL